MAVVQRSIDIVSLALKHADSIVKLLSYAVVLVACCIILPREGRVMRTYFGYV
jgi:hypothetical protein